MHHKYVPNIFYASLRKHLTSSLLKKTGTPIAINQSHSKEQAQGEAGNSTTKHLLLRVSTHFLVEENFQPDILHEELQVVAKERREIIQMKKLTHTKKWR